VARGGADRRGVDVSGTFKHRANIIHFECVGHLRRYVLEAVKADEAQALPLLKDIPRGIVSSGRPRPWPERCTTRLLSTRQGEAGVETSAAPLPSSRTRPAALWQAARGSHLRQRSLAQPRSVCEGRKRSHPHRSERHNAASAQPKWVCATICSSVTPRLDGDRRLFIVSSPRVGCWVSTRKPTSVGCCRSLPLQLTKPRSTCCLTTSHGCSCKPIRSRAANRHLRLDRLGDETVALCEIVKVRHGRSCNLLPRVECDARLQNHFADPTPAFR
jgi:hypothetical protein